jgi:hypothetical protein
MGLDAATRDRVATFMAASPVDRVVSALQTLTYLGLRLRKPWVVPLIVGESVYLMTPCLSTPPEGLMAVVVVRAVSALALYQLWFFSRPSTRRCFGAEGTVVL